MPVGESLSAVILGICMNCFSWKAEDLDKCRVDLSAYSQSLQAYEENMLKLEHRAFGAAQHQRKLARDELDLCIVDAALIDNVSRLIKSANEEREHYEQIHSEVAIAQTEVHRMRLCIQDIIARLGRLRESLRSEPTDEPIELPSDLMDLFESIDEKDI